MREREREREREGGGRQRQREIQRETERERERQRDTERERRRGVVADSLLDDQRETKQIHINAEKIEWKHKITYDMQLASLITDV